MRYIVKLYMEGDFPGSPDHDYYEIDETAWDEVCKILFKFQRYDTLEQALEKSNKKVKRMTGKYYREGTMQDSSRYICNCGFRTDSFMGIQSHIRTHKKMEMEKENGQQELPTGSTISTGVKSNKS